MKRRIPGLAQAALREDDPPDGYYLVRISRARYHSDKHKPYYTLSFEIEAPSVFKGQELTARLYCSVRALWKFNWFLREFDYDRELLGREELDERALCDLRGVVKTSHTTFNGQRYLNLDAFAHAGEWYEWYAPQAPPSEVA